MYPLLKKTNTYTDEKNVLLNSEYICIFLYPIWTAIGRCVFDHCNLHFSSNAPALPMDECPQCYCSPCYAHNCSYCALLGSAPLPLFPLERSSTPSTSSMNSSPHPHTNKMCTHESLALRAIDCSQGLSEERVSRRTADKFHTNGNKLNIKILINSPPF